MLHNTCRLAVYINCHYYLIAQIIAFERKGSRMWELKMFLKYQKTRNLRRGISQTASQGKFPGENTTRARMWLDNRALCGTLVFTNKSCLLVHHY